MRVWLSGIILLVLMGCGGLISPTPTANVGDTVGTTSIAVSGKAFGQLFSAGYGYAQTDGITLSLFFNTGRRTSCLDVLPNETPRVSISAPPQVGLHPKGSAYASWKPTQTLTLEFIAYNLEIFEIGATHVRGKATLHSTNGTVLGEFNLPICP